MFRFLATNILVLFALFSAACSKQESSGTSSQSSFAFTEEPAFCETVSPISGGLVLTARAQFLARQVTASGLLGPGPVEDIKFAEVEVTDARGIRIQCGTTDENGGISMLLPRNPGNYNLRVYSRSDSSSYKVSVLNNPTQNLPYSVSVGFSISAETSSLAPVLPTAPFDASLEGGAFNIMNQVYRANAFIRQNSACPEQVVCEPFTVAPKVRVFWTPGLSPYSYYGSPSTPISFFSSRDDSSARIRRGLYIQGGIKGDVNCSDTDHFDNSVVLHEYGHFLEDSFARSDSPGGSHNGNFIIDPRLAWSEGWANFFQTAVQDSSVYRDTVGNSTCAGGTFLGVNLNLETAVSGQDRMPAGTLLGEGIFREVSVSRVLWDFMDDSGVDGGAGLGFALIWKVFSDATSGFRSPELHFRNIGLFNQKFRDLVSSVLPGKVPDIDLAMTPEYQVANTSFYGQRLTLQPTTTCSFSIQGVPDTYFMGAFVSNIFKSNHFYEVQNDGSFLDLELHYSGNSPSDLDLILYPENHVFDDENFVLRSSQRLYPESAGSGLERINLSGLPVGTYMLNVRVNTDELGGAANYYLSTPGGARFCP
jgi:hypothetical protein